MRTKQDLGKKKRQSQSAERPRAEEETAQKRNSDTLASKMKTDHHGRSRGLNKYLLNECVNGSDQHQQRFLDRQGDHEKKMLLRRVPTPSF